MKNSSHILHIITTSVAFVIATLLIIISAQFGLSPKNLDAAVTTQSRLTEYAWSDNIGWISFKDGSSPVLIDSNGYLNGYAWSDAVGWIQFGGLSGFPNNNFGANAQITGNAFTGNFITGWARAVSGMPPTSGVDNRGGFDGWISLGGPSYTIGNMIAYGLKLDGNPVSGTKITGFAWGSDVFGWIDFSGVRISGMQNPCTGPYGTTIPDGQNFVFYSQADNTGTCASEVRTCTNGSLSGSLSEISCVNTTTCTRGGKTFNPGDKVVFFAKAIAGQGQTCASMQAELTCTDGKFVDSQGNVDNLNTNLKCINNPTYIEQ